MKFTRSRSWEGDQAEVFPGRIRIEKWLKPSSFLIILPERIWSLLTRLKSDPVERCEDIYNFLTVRTHHVCQSLSGGGGSVRYKTHGQRSQFTSSSDPIGAKNRISLFMHSFSPVPVSCPSSIYAGQNNQSLDPYAAIIQPGGQVFACLFCITRIGFYQI